MSRLNTNTSKNSRNTNSNERNTEKSKKSIDTDENKICKDKKVKSDITDRLYFVFCWREFDSVKDTKDVAKEIEWEVIDREKEKEKEREGGKESNANSGGHFSGMKMRGASSNSLLQISEKNNDGDKEIQKDRDRNKGGGDLVVRRGSLTSLGSADSTFSTALSATISSTPFPTSTSSSLLLSAGYNGISRSKFMAAHVQRYNLYRIKQKSIQHNTTHQTVPSMYWTFVYLEFEFLPLEQYRLINDCLLLTLPRMINSVLHNLVNSNTSSLCPYLCPSI